MESNNNVLIISNNVLSSTSNNGKTLFSLFENIKDKNIYQLYFSNETPEIDFASYYRITDKELLNFRLFRKKEFGPVEVKHRSIDNAKSFKRHSNISRLLRELLWIKFENNSNSKEWIGSIRPKYVFFVGGDFCFAHRLFSKLKEICSENTKFALYITDDYVDYRGVKNPFEIIRKRIILKHLKRSVDICDSFFTIGEKMKNYYLQLFNKKSEIIYNISVPYTNAEGFRKINLNSNKIVFAYAGSLYYGRERALIEFAKNLSKINKNFILKVYSSQKNRLKYKMVTFCGKKNREELNSELKKADYLLYAESFKKKHIRKIRYSFSTKIFEYLAFNKPIVTYGPIESYSIEVLSKGSYYVSKRKFKSFNFFKEQLGCLSLLDREMILQKFLEFFDNENFAI